MQPDVAYTLPDAFHQEQPTAVPGVLELTPGMENVMGTLRLATGTGAPVVAEANARRVMPLTVTLPDALAPPLGSNPVDHAGRQAGMRPQQAREPRPSAWLHVQGP